MPDSLQTRQSAPERISYSVSEVAKAIGISDRQVYLMCEREELASYRLGRRVLIWAWALDAWRKAMAEKQPA